MRNKIIGLVGLVAVGLFLTGCGSTRARALSGPQYNWKFQLVHDGGRQHYDSAADYAKCCVYGGIREDIIWLGGPWLDTALINDAQGGIVVLEPPLGLMDLPISVALDTVLLPYDVWEVATFKKQN